MAQHCTHTAASCMSGGRVRAVLAPATPADPWVHGTHVQHLEPKAHERPFVQVPQRHLRGRACSRPRSERHASHMLHAPLAACRCTSWCKGWRSPAALPLEAVQPRTLLSMAMPTRPDAPAGGRVRQWTHLLPCARDLRGFCVMQLGPAQHLRRVLRRRKRGLRVRASIRMHSPQPLGQSRGRTSRPTASSPTQFL